MDLGSLIATFGIDLSELNQAEGAVRNFGAVAESSLGQAAAASESLISSLVALTGVVLSVGGAFSAFKGGIEMIDQFNLKVISNAAMLTNLYNGPPEKAQEAYAQFKAYVLDMYSAFTAEAAKHISKASDLQDTFKAFSQFGVKATKDQAGAIGVITDAVRLLNNGMMSEGSMLHEIMGLEAGHASVRFKLGMQVRQIEGENWHQVYLEHKKIGDLIPWLASLYKGLAAATSDVQKELLSQRTTLQGLTAFITRQGLAGAYEDVVAVVKKLNDYLTAHRDVIIKQMVESWDKFRNAIIETSDKIDEFATKHPILMSLGGILVQLTAYTVGLSTAVRTIKASWDWVSGGIIAAVGTVTGAFRAILGVVGGVTSEFYAVMTSAGIMGEAIGTAPGLGAAVAVSAIITMAGHIAARLAKLVVDWISSWEIAGNTVGDYCNLGLLYFEQFGISAASVIQNTVTVIERAWEEMTYVLKKGFLDVLSIGQNLPMVGGAFSGFEGQSKELDKDHEKTVKRINDHIELLNKQNEAIKKNFQVQMDAINNRKKAETGVKSQITDSSQNLPSTKPGDVGKTKKGGGGKGAEGVENQVQSIMSTLNQEMMKINEGAANEVLGWANKMVIQLEKLQAKGADISEALPLVWKVALDKEKKLQEDFSKWYAGNIGDNYAKINFEHDESIKKYVMNQETMLKISEQTGTSMVALTAQNEATKQQISEVTSRKIKLEDISRQSQLINLSKQYYDQMEPLLSTMEQQNSYKRESLLLENKLAILAVEKLVTENKRLEPYKDQLLLMQAMVNQGKLFNLEMENNKGLQGWAYGRVKSDSQKSTVSDMMGSFESGLQSSFSSAWQGFLTQDKKNLQKAGESIFQGILGEVTKGSVTKLFSGFAKLISPQSLFGSSESDMGSGKGLASTVSSSGAQLSQAAAGLNKASVGFNTNTAQFGLAAGGLLLSGIGIATNSQAMVYAGMVLQVAGMAIQIYEALTATTTVASMTTAAAALSASAVALSSAAVALGGSAASSSGGGILSGLTSIVGWFMHSGGHVPAIYAHSGLAPHEVPIIALDSERVLNPRQTYDYEAGMRAAGARPGENGSGGLRIGSINIDARGADKDIDWKKVVRTQVGPELKKLAKQNRMRLG